MATNASSTRRGLLAAATTLPALIATPIAAKEIGRGEAWRLKKRAFIEQVSKLHPRGRLVATRAMAMDLDPDEIAHIQLDAENTEMMPALTFRGQKPRPYCDWIVVGPDYAYQHGPV